MDNVRWCVERGIHVVVGTTGFDEERLQAVRSWLQAAPGIGVAIVPNFGIGSTLMMAFAERAARYFDSAEIIELHHSGKVDAPSGTARRTAARMGAARLAAEMPAMSDASAPGVVDARGTEVDGVRIHSVRLRGLIARQEVMFGRHGELLTIRHDCLDRASYLPGVLLVVRQIGDRPGLSVGLETFLEL
jgi:4-hydroxy-tetrahydrodipicolinate reductase